jgi:hypothetical protein
MDRHADLPLLWTPVFTGMTVFGVFEDFNSLRKEGQKSESIIRKRKQKSRNISKSH